MPHASPVDLSNLPAKKKQRTNQPNHVVTPIFQASYFFCGWYNETKYQRDGKKNCVMSENTTNLFFPYFNADKVLIISIHFVIMQLNQIAVYHCMSSLLPG